MSTATSLRSYRPGRDEDVKEIESEHVEKSRDGQDNAYSGFSDEDQAFMKSFTKDRVDKVLRKIDWRLVPVLALLYLISYLDRANIGNANIEGLSADLKMTGDQYNIALCVFFIPYCILEVPSNIILQKFRRPSHWIGIMTVAWGIVMTLTGVVKNYEGLVACRFFLGITESGFYPGAILIVSSWYAANEVGTRIALFYTASALAGAFSGLLAFGIVKMDGIGGYAGWRWIFIIEGIVTVILGCLVPFILIDKPELSNWLDDDEKRFLLLRKQFRDGGNNISSKGKKFSWPVLRSVLTDYKLYLSAIIYWCSTGPNFGLKFTMPRIIKNMGYSSANAQLLTVPPYTVGAISAYVACKYSDRFKWRLPFIVVSQIFVIVGFAILFGFAGDLKHRVGESYFAIFLACIGFYPINPNLAAWTSNNLAGPAKRATGIGFMLMMANTAGIVGSFMYIEKESPTYPTGYGASIGIMGAGLVTALILEFCLWTTNKRDAKFTEAEIRAKYTDQQLADMGDASPLLKYTL